MKFYRPHIFKSLIITTLLVGMFASTNLGVFTVRTAHAQGMNVPIGTDFDFNSIMDHSKNFILDKAATAIAKQLLHQMTTSVINWINSGFDGSPSFITNPGGFFLDAADQVTGEFLASGGGGPLANLCSPFSFDIRLNLALQISGRQNQRYTCTLGTIIQNTRDAAKRGVTINGFTAGDFSQGGWASFIALSTEPQNNYAGAYLYAHSDLLSRISKKHSEINIDLNRGRGFLSTTRCTDVTSSYTNQGGNNALQQPGNQTVQTGQAIDGENTSIKKTVDKNTGLVKYESCKTETPGSMIENSLATQMGSSVRELELADDINAVINALVGKMVSVMLEKGLSNLSSNSSGGGGSYTSKILRESEKEGEMARKQLIKDIDAGVKTLTSFKAIYDQAVTLVVENKNRYETARTCFVTKAALSANSSNQSFFQTQISAIDSALTVKVNPLLADMTAKQVNAGIQIQQLQDAKNTGLATTTNPEQQMQNYLGISELAAAATSRVNMSIARDDLKATQDRIKDYNTEAIQYQNACNNYSATNP